MAAPVPGTAQFAELATTPSAPNTGYSIIYMKSDHVLYIQNEFGIEVPIGTASGITSLTGDVTATGPGSAVATVAFVGGATAANVALAVTAYLAATSSNTPNTLILRDGSGNFSAGTITANLTGNISGSATSFTGPLVGDVTGTQGATVVSLVGGKTAAQVATSVNDTIAATSINSASTIVRRDVSGNFAAGIITANITGNVSGSSGSFTGSLVGDVTGTQGATVVSTVGTKTAAQVSTSVDATLAATSSNTASTIVKRDASGNFSAGTITANLTGNVNGVDPAAHGARHSPTGADPVSTSAAATLIPDQSNATGTSSDLARADHIHNIPSGAVVQIGTANFNGAALSFALADHIHSHGAQTNTTLHALATSIAHGFMSSTDKAKLDASTASNTPSTLVQRDASGNFSASVITANLTGNVSGSAASFTGPLSGDVTGTQSATSISDTTVTSKLLTGYVIGANTPIAATDSILIGFEKLQGQVSAGAGSAITALTGDVTATGPGSVPATIPVGTVTDTKASLAVKPAVTVVATTNQALTGTPTIDGQTTAAGSIILLTAQTTGSQNGPWVAAAGAWSRPTWYPSGGTTQSFQFITTLVRLGTIYQGSIWRQTTAAPVTIDTTSTTWVVTPTSGNYKSSYKIGPQTGSSEVDLVFSNANNGTLGWNPSTTISLILPPAAPTAGSYLGNTATPGVLEWSNPLTNIDGGRPDSVYTAAQVINGGTA